MANDKLTLDVVQAAELKYAFERTGWNNAEIKALSSGDVLAGVRDVIRGFAKIEHIKYIIDCDADPFVPEGWKVEEHRKHGMLEWNSTRIKLHLSPNQMDGKIIEGNKLRKELASEPVLNANVLDYLLKHPELIPEEWKGKLVFFWGTIYRRSGGSLYVRFLIFDSGGWCWRCRWLSDGFRSYYPAACSQDSSRT